MTDIAPATEDDIVAPAKRLDPVGRCCGRKPIAYKRPSPHFFCARCDAEFSPTGEQVENWAFRREPDGSFSYKMPHMRKSTP